MYFASIFSPHKRFFRAEELSSWLEDLCVFRKWHHSHGNYHHEIRRGLKTSVQVSKGKTKKTKKTKPSYGLGHV